LEKELKRQKMLLDANTALNQVKIKADTTKEMVSLEALERRELEFQQLQEKEKERAIDAQQKLREIATLEVKERVHLERELAKQQQQNIILQKQNEIDHLNAEADKKLFQQRFENAEKLAALQREKEFQKEKQMGTAPSTDVVSQPEIVVAESSDSDSTPPPSQIRRRVVRRIIDNTEHLVVVQELPTTDVMCTSSQHIGVSQVTGPCVGMATSKVPVVTQAPAYASPADLGYQTTMADPGLRQVVHIGATQVAHPVRSSETNLGLLGRERAENAKLHNDIFKMQLELEREDTEGERRHDDAASEQSELEQHVALMTLNQTPATRGGRRCGRCGNRSCANWRAPRGRGRGSNVGIDAPQGTNVNIAWHY